MSPIRRLRGVAALSAAALATTGVAGHAIGADEDCDDPFCKAVIGVDSITDGGDGAAGGIDLGMLRSLLEQQGVPDEVIEQTLTFYSQIDGGAPDVRAMIEAFSGEQIPEEALLKIEGMFDEGALGEDAIDPALIKIDPSFLKIEDAFEKVTPFYDEDGALFLKIEGIDGEALGEDGELFLKIEGIDGEADGDVMVKVEGVDGTIDEEAFLKIEGIDGEADGGELFLKIEGIDGEARLTEDALLKLGGALTVAEAALAQAVADGDLSPETLDAILRMLPDE